MRMPGLTAEAALTETSGRHRSGKHHGRADRGLGPVRAAGLGEDITVYPYPCIPIVRTICMNNPNFPHPICFHLYGCLPV